MSPRADFASYNSVLLKDSRYAEAGVDIEAKSAALSHARKSIRSTFTSGVLGDIGGFGGLFRPDFSCYREPVLVASTDGVGTKLKVAIEVGRHDTCGADLVNHCVNDILVQGARPLFFLDYIAMGRLDADVLTAVIEGVARGCRENKTALLGGETAEMPGLYAPGDYDVAGTIVGVVDRDKILDGSRVRAGDVVLGLPSAGLHTNGYSLARKILLGDLGKRPADRMKALGGQSIADALLAPHLSYLATLEPLLAEDLVQAMAHITGGGFYDNIPRVLPEGAGVVIRAGSWPVPAIFGVLEKEGRVSPEEMYRVFNMGIGMALLIAPERVPRVSQVLTAGGKPHYFLGSVVAGSRRVKIDFP